MLNWYEEDGRYLGFDDDTYMYRVAKDENGWYYEHVIDLDGMEGYDTAEEAKAAAEEDISAHEISFDWQDIELILTPEELDEILGDRLYDERKDDTLVGW